MKKSEMRSVVYKVDEKHDEMLFALEQHHYAQHKQRLKIKTFLDTLLEKAYQELQAQNNTNKQAQNNTAEPVSEPQADKENFSL